MGAQAPTDTDTPTWGGEAVVTETQEDRDRLGRPVGAEPDVEERFRALQLTDERQQAELNELRASLTQRLQDIDYLGQRVADIDIRLRSTEEAVDMLEASQSPRSDAWRRLSSRKFLFALVAFIGSIVGGLSGWIPPEVAAVLATATAGLYALAEAWVDNGTEKAKAEVAKAVATLRPPV